MSPRVTTARTATAATAILAIVLSCFTLAIHAGPDAVGASARVATTLYHSQHSGQSSEDHLHAETGIESFLCLACFLSLRDRVMPGDPRPEFALQQSESGTPDGSSEPPALAWAASFSSRAPPRA